MRVLLTGHKGYIGGVAVPLLAAAGHEIVGLDSGLFEDCLFGEPYPAIPEIRKDLREVAVADLEGFDAVLHLAALSNDPLGNLNSGLTYDINYRASVRLAQLARQAGVQRFVFSSSCSTYGAAGDHFLDETAGLNPVTPYAESKVLVERELSAMADDRFSPTYMRNATAYGVSPYLRLDVVLNNLVAYAFATGRILMQSDGSPWRPIVHIEDIVHAALCILEAPRDAIHNATFNVGATSENYRIRELAEIVAETVPGCAIDYAPNAGPDKRCYRVTFEKIRHALPGFQPRWNARQGARQLYEAFCRIGLTREDLEGPRYTRLRQIRRLMDRGQLDGTLRWRTSEMAAAV